jgi:hypothetical protein
MERRDFIDFSFLGGALGNRKLDAAFSARIWPRALWGGHGKTGAELRPDHGAFCKRRRLNTG